MKSITSFVLGIIATVVMAQKSPDVIYCNDFQNVAIVMDTPIAQAVTGSEDFVFSYNQTAADSLGLLQGRPGKDSNLLIRTTDGGLYTYILRYTDSLQQFIHFIGSDKMVNKQIELEKNGLERSEQVFACKPTSKKTEELRKLSKYYLNRTSILLGRTSNQGLKMKVEGMYHFKEQVYLVINLKNGSGIDYKIEDLRLTKLHGSKKRKSSFQELFLKDVFRFEFPDQINRGMTVRFVMVYPKFTLGNHDRLQLEMSEADGSRYLRLNFK
ncbi:DUF4138 domain-containing protein [Gramella sp. BOM4]|nr:DUF4138 domain-containing protein [Christiangramia bathymodioli]